MPDLGTIQNSLSYYRDLGNSNSGHSPKALFSGESNRVIRVDDTTFQRLKVSDALTKTINNMFDASNQLPVVFETGGLAFLKSQSLRRGEFDTTNPISSGLFVGRCGEHARACDMSAAALNNHYQRSGISFPIMKAEWSGDHAFHLLGDPRELNAREVVVLDAWPTKPSAHTLDQNSLNGRANVSSSTTQVSRGFLRESLYKMSDNSYLRAKFDRDLSSREKRNLSQALLTDISNRHNSGRNTGLWHQETFKRNSIVQTYENRQTGERVSFDYNVRREVNAVNQSVSRMHDANFPNEPPE